MQNKVLISAFLRGVLVGWVIRLGFRVEGLAFYLFTNISLRTLCLSGNFFLPQRREEHKVAEFIFNL